MTKIITCSELRHRTLAELEALFRTLQIELGRTAPVRANAPLCSPTSKASAASWRCAVPGSRSRERKQALHSCSEAAAHRGFIVFRRQDDPVRFEARRFRASRRSRNGRDWRPPRSSAGQRSLRCCSNYAA